MGGGDVWGWVRESSGGEMETTVLEQVKKKISHMRMYQHTHEYKLERKAKNDFSGRLIQAWVTSFCLVTLLIPVASCRPAAVFHNLKPSSSSGCV